MSLTPAIRVEAVCKQYQIGGADGEYRTLRDSLVQSLSYPFRRIAGKTADVAPTIWALRNVSFEVKPGEVVGLIGRNGAGKSTLLKVLSRITEPTSGRVRIRGRVASLLEVGTGFHGELSGRENLYLNGAILGMTRRELDRKFDEIVAFAEVEKFIDTPVKRYSSGMYLRLAFAVAAHLQPEILIVDEILAVGDARFQSKCLGKMEEVGREGRTVLFVSHNMPMVARLCSRAVLLSEGTVVSDGPASQVITEYLRSGTGSPAIRIWSEQDRPLGNEVIQVASVRVLDESQSPAEVIDIRRPVSIEVVYRNLQSELKPTVSLQFFNEDGIFLFCSNDFNNQRWWNTPRQPGMVRSVCTIPGNFLAEGRIYVTLGMSTYNPDRVHAYERDVVSFQVVDQSQGDGVRGVYAKRWPGVMRPMLDWTIVADHPAGNATPAY